MAATKTAKARNSERRSGKAWGKNHGVVKAKPVKVAEAGPKVSKGGSPVTMPSVSFEAMGRMMASRWPSTRKLAAIDSYINWSKGRTAVREDGISVSSRKNGR